MIDWTMLLCACAAGIGAGVIGVLLAVRTKNSETLTFRKEN